MTAWVLGAIHALVDTASLAILYYEVPLRRLTPGDIGLLILVYNCLAFGLQAPLGWLSDRLDAHRTFAVAGMIVTALAAIFSVHWAWAAAVVVAVGNALFHVGGGAIVLRSCGGRATTPGIFVGPGAMGVALGIWLGLAGFPLRGLFVLALAACATLVALTRLSPRTPVIPVWGHHGARPARGAFMFLALSVLLLTLSVTARSTGGGIVRSWWPEQVDTIAMLLAGAAVVGKIMGGFLADRIGWRIVGAGALLVAVAPVWLGPHEAPWLILDTLLIQMTMAVTLTGIYLAMPNRPGLAFGLPSLALVIGSHGVYKHFVSFDATAWLPPLLLISAAMIYVGLTFPLLCGGRKASTLE